MFNQYLHRMPCKRHISIPTLHEMKKFSRDEVTRLEDLPNIGKGMARYFRMIGIKHPGDLKGKDPLKLYQELCAITGKLQDPCVMDVFMAAVHLMDGGEPLPWWHFTPERKKMEFFRKP